MPEDTRLRSPRHERDSILEWSQKPSTKAELEDLRAKVNQLEYGGITADKLGGGTLSQHSIRLAEDGVIYAGNIQNGFILSEEGLAFYDGGVNTIFLSANGGGAHFEGNIEASTITGGIIQSAASGSRIVISDSAVDEINFYTGDAAETSPGRVLVFADPSWLVLGWSSPRAGFHYIETAVAGGKSGSDPAYWSVIAYDGSANNKGSIDLDSQVGFRVANVELAEFEVQDGYFQFARPSATNVTQLRFKTVPAPGTFEVAFGVDAATGAQVNVQSWASTTPLPISASAFSVVSKAEGKDKVAPRTDTVLNRVKALKPVNYVRRHADDTEHSYVGFLAEEMLTQFPEAVVRDIEGNPHSIDLMAMVAILCQGVQELATRGN